MRSIVLGPRFQAAFTYVAGRTEGRMRTNTHVPALAHAMAVSALVLDLGGAEDEAIGALLHDVVEDAGDDGPQVLASIGAQWGEDVRALVEACSDEIVPSGRSWRERKAGYLARMPSASPAALRISLADKADNTRTLLRAYDERGAALFTDHAAGSREALLWYYEALVAEFARRDGDLGPHAAPLIAELRATVVALGGPAGSRASH